MSAELVAHRAGNRADTALAVGDRADMIELDVHVLYGRVELRHEKVFRPTRRLWERWYVLPRESRGTEISEVLEALDPSVPLMLDLKCFTRRAARRIRDAVPSNRNIVASTRNWWVLSAFPATDDAVEPAVRRLRSCRSRWQVALALKIRGLDRGTGVVAHHEILDAALVGRIRARTPHLFTWAVPDPSRAAELVEWGVTGLIVDDLDQRWPRH
ncbi:MAG: hypothetical protein ACR2P0_05965 [Acidimicrobiales bacterium]